ncbi:MAG: c-type cytochrome [Pseudomonadota bacterium]
MIQFVSVIGGLVVIGVACIILANWLGARSSDPSDPFTSQVIEERIKPVGEVYVGSVPAEALAKVKQAADAAAAPTATKPAFASGKEVYDSVCLACHSTGAAGAPKYGEKDAWAKYLEKGVEGNYAVAINGAGAMPPKGGRMDLSEDDVKSAVDYMLEALE